VEAGDAVNEYAKPIDVTANAELRRLVRLVKETGQTVPLIEDNEIVALVQPALPPERTGAPRQSPEDFYAKAVARPDVAEILRRLAQ
jgi:hypothetical protein